MPRSGVPLLPPITRTLDYKALVVKSWGDDWLKPEVAYRFSNNRTFNDSGAYGGVYIGTATA